MVLLTHRNFKHFVSAVRPRVDDLLRISFLIEQTHANNLYAKVAGRLWVEADRYDPLVHAARALYEAGRLDGYGLLEALGSFIFRPAEYVEDQP